MVVGCAGTKADGTPCRTRPLRGERHCLWHSPDHTEEAAEARRLGGLRRKRERTVALAYDLEPLDSVASIRRLLDIAAVDTLSLENSVARSRVLLGIVGVAAKLAEVEREEGMAWAEV
jgi:hypothetical protein